ncbi:MAG TPA: ATP synthase F1 subunit epsilon [Bryobacteraceae bacterium]|nr:ATP synthase F1 subunit epsilon [Bryobacteraceae bacterium]
MPELIELEVATPERLMVRENVAEVQIPGKDGYLGILPGHAPLLGQLGTGVLSYGLEGRRRSLSVQGGFLEVLPEHVRVLANLAERAEDIDVERAKADLRRAQDQVGNPDPSVDPSIALDALALAQARIEAAGK